MSARDMPAGESERKPARYPQVLRAVCESPWAIRAEKLVVIRELLALRASGERFTHEEISARIGAGPATKQSSSVGTVAVIPIYGVITPKADLFTEMSGGTSVQGLSDVFRAAVADDSIGAILLDVDSPGGMTDLIPEFAAEIRDARGSKPIVAIANTDAASAAYWLASQADEFVVTPSGMVGSIGVFAAHDDLSGAMEQDGIKTTLISAGKFKTESNPFEPLSDEARAAIQARVDTFYGLFVEDVAQGRGVSAGAVRSGFGEGRIVTAQDALAAGMVDRVDTFESTVERLIVQAATSTPVRQAALTVNQQLTSATGASVSGSPPTLTLQTLHTEAAQSGPSFVQSAVAVQAAADKLVRDARSLNGTRRPSRLTAAKCDGMTAAGEALIASGQELLALVAESEADPGSDALARRLLVDAQRRHFPTTGVAR